MFALPFQTRWVFRLMFRQRWVVVGVVRIRGWLRIECLRTAKRKPATKKAHASLVNPRKQRKTVKPGSMFEDDD